MSVYTTQLRYICESLIASDEPSEYSISAVVEKSRPLLFDFDFPIYDEAHRQVLETKIMKHYWMREIGLETYGAFKLALDTKMNEIMPKYNLLYAAEAQKNNPFDDVNLTRKISRGLKGSGTSKTGTTSSNQVTNSGSDITTHSDTPQGTVQNLKDGKYLTSADIYNAGTVSDSSGTSTGNGETTSESKENVTEKLNGKQGGVSYYKMMAEYAQSIMNIDLMIIQELEELFMLLW